MRVVICISDIIFSGHDDNVLFLDVILVIRLRLKKLCSTTAQPLSPLTNATLSSWIAGLVRGSRLAVWGRKKNV